ncbi:MAG: PAS domain-containing sensor histidine kinase [Steroidobacteraceae bacterium]
MSISSSEAAGITAAVHGPHAHTPGGAAALRRFLLPWGLAAPVAGGAIILFMQELGHLTTSSGVAFLAGFCAIFFAATVVLADRRLARVEQARASAERALLQTRERMDTALLANEIGTWEWNITSDRVFADASLAAMLGISPADAEGGPLSIYLQAVHPEDRHLARAAIDQALRDGSYFSCEYRLRPEQGTERRVLARGRVLRDSEGTPARLPGVVLDISEQRWAERQLQRSGSARRDALEPAAAQSPAAGPATLRSAQTTASASLQGISTGPEVGARRAPAPRQMVDDLLDLSSIISGKVKLLAQPVAIAAVVTTAIENVRAAAAARRLSIESLFHPGSQVVVTGDPARLQQVLSNLLSNAIKFTPPGGQISVCLRRIDGEVELAVSDNGAGISSEFLPLVFDRFRQADAVTAGQRGGLGLGLSIVRQLAELHGGSVRAGSPGRGLGSTFVVVLPIAATSPAATGNDQISGRSRNGSA